MTNIVAVIPAYNASRHIVTVLTGVAAYIPLQYVCVIDDGSEDDTAKLAKDLGAVLLEHGENRGKGTALATGFTWAAGMNAEAIVTLDADGQHAPEAIPSFISTFRQSGCDIVVGSRMHASAAMPVQRRITNTLASRVLSYVTGQFLADSQCGFRLIRARVLQSITMSSGRFEAESNFLAAAAAAGFRIGSVPVPVIYGNERSSFKIFSDTYRMMRTLAGLGLKRLAGRTG